MAGNQSQRPHLSPCRFANTVATLHVFSHGGDKPFSLKATLVFLRTLSVVNFVFLFPTSSLAPSLPRPDVHLSIWLSHVYIK